MDMRPAFVLALFLTLVVLAVTLLWPFGFGHSVASKKTEALSNHKSVSMSMTLYLEDSGGVFPACDNWEGALRPYIKNREVLQSRYENNVVLSVAMNALLDRKAMRKTTDPARLVTLFQVVGPANNSWGGPNGAWEGYGDKHTVHIGFADGHVKPVPRNELDALQWRP